MDKEELLTFWKSSGSQSKNFLQDSSTLQEHFSTIHNLARSSGKNDRICIKKLYHRGRIVEISPVKFCKSSRLRIQT